MPYAITRNSRLTLDLSLLCNWHGARGGGGEEGACPPTKSQDVHALGAQFRSLCVN